MKKIIYTGLITLMVSCGSKSVSTKQTSTDSTSKETVSQNQENVVNANIPVTTEITAENAGQVTSFENTPESIVMYFFASKIRKDNKWEEVCVSASERSGKFSRGLEEYTKWTFTKYRFVDKKEVAVDKFWVKIYMSIMVEGDSDDGEDDVTVEMINGKWMITEVPT